MSHPFLVSIEYTKTIVHKSLYFADWLIVHRLFEHEELWRAVSPIKPPIFVALYSGSPVIGSQINIVFIGYLQLALTLYGELLTLHTVR